MTYTEEFVPEDEQGLEEEENYPTAFGITFTPQVTGIGLALLGAIAGVYILINFVMPAYDSYNKLKQDEQSKQQQVEKQKSGQIDQKQLEAKNQLEQAKAKKEQVLAMFSDEKSIQTFLFDVNRFFQARNVKLVNFQPQGDATVINDGSLGAAANNKLKRQSFNLEMEGSFKDTQNLLRDLERFQPLVVIKGLNSQFKGGKYQVSVIDQKSKQPQVITDEETIKTTFGLDVILPLSPEDLAKLAPPPSPSASPSPSPSPAK